MHVVRNNFVEAKYSPIKIYKYLQNTTKFYYTLPLVDYMFRLLRVIIRPSSELIFIKSLSLEIIQYKVISCINCNVAFVISL